MIKGFIAFLLEKEKAPKSVRTYTGAVQSLGSYWKVPISTEYAELPPSIVTNEKYPWDIEQVGRFIKSMKSPMHRCLGTWYIESGLSNYDLLHLTYGKIKEQLETDVSPICLNLVRHKTRKFKVQFRSFIGYQGIQYFKQYRSGRKPLADDDLLFKVSDSNTNSISDNAIESYFNRRALKFLPEDFIRSKRNPCCPSSFRTGFRTFLSDAKCPESIIEYFMGHNLSGDLKKVYTNKSDASWRSTYKEYEPALTFTE